MSTKMNIPFSPPDVGEEEINEVVDALKSGWITTGPKTKQRKASKNISYFSKINSVLISSGKKR